jgi:magnesium-transporting ATPase (P-type)
VVKGAPEYVIKSCNNVLDADGQIKKLDEDEKQRILSVEIEEAMAKQGLRTLVYAYKDMDSDAWEYL